MIEIIVDDYGKRMWFCFGSSDNPSCRMFHINLSVFNVRLDNMAGVWRMGRSYVSELREYGSRSFDWNSL